jgi:hypothetical protein
MKHFALSASALVAMMVAASAASPVKVSNANLLRGREVPSCVSKLPGR